MILHSMKYNASLTYFGRVVRSTLLLDFKCDCVILVLWGLGNYFENDKLRPFDWPFQNKRWYFIPRTCYHDVSHSTLQIIGLYHLVKQARQSCNDLMRQVYAKRLLFLSNLFCCILPFVANITYKLDVILVAIETIGISSSILEIRISSYHLVPILV